MKRLILPTLVYVFTIASALAAEQTCSNGGKIYYWNKFMLINNLWDLGSAGNGSWGCVYKYSGDDSGVQWDMKANNTYNVKSYQGVYYGWSFKGWSGPDVELPVKVGDNKNIKIGWHYTISDYNGIFNCAWDIW